MSGFDDDDHIQQAIALIVLVAVALLAIFLAPTGNVVTLVLWGSGGVAALWYLFISKGIVYPFLWIDGMRDLAKMLFRRSR